jgi:hypothetical protein
MKPGSSAGNAWVGSLGYGSTRLVGTGRVWVQSPQGRVHPGFTRQRLLLHQQTTVSYTALYRNSIMDIALIAFIVRSWSSGAYIASYDNYIVLHSLVQYLWITV